MDTRKLGAIDTSPGHKEQDNQVSSFACVKHKNIHPNTDESPELREIIDKLTFVSVVQGVVEVGRAFSASGPAPKPKGLGHGRFHKCCTFTRQMDCILLGIEL